MTDEDLKPYLGMVVRLTLSNDDVLTGVLRADHDHGDTHVRYVVASPPTGQDSAIVSALIHGSDLIVAIEHATHGARTTS